MFLDSVPLLALQNFNWKIKKGKKPLFGAGFKTAHGVTRSAHKIYEIDFEIKEILTNSAINVAQTAKNAAFLNIFEDFTDIRNAVIIIMYPGAAAVRSKTFTGIEITDQEGGFPDSEDAVHLGRGNIMISTTWCGYGAWLVVMRSDGEIFGQIIDDGLAYATFQRLLVTRRGGIYAVGSTGEDYFEEDNQIWLVRIDGPDNVDDFPYSNNPSQFSLLPPFPNPFNTSFTIPYRLDEQSEVNIRAPRYIMWV